MIKVSVPTPEILAPIEFKQFIKSAISGSFAAFDITVWPLARVAAITAFSVPVTVTIEKCIFAPTKPPLAEALI